jgi:hypothetical protein
MAKKERDTQVSDDSTLELLLVSLEQAMDTKQQNDAAIARIRESLSQRVDQIQQAKAVIDRTIAENGSAPSLAKFSPLFTAFLQKIWIFCRQWIFPAVIMFAILWAVMWAMQRVNTESSEQWQIPSLTEAAYACNLSTRFQERHTNNVESLLRESSDVNLLLATNLEEEMMSVSFVERGDDADGENTNIVIEEPPAEQQEAFSNSRQIIRKPFLRNLFKSR